MTLRSRDRIKTSLVDLNLVPLGIRSLQRIRYGRCWNTNIDSGVFLAAADAPFERQHEITKLLLGVPIEAVPAGGFKHRSMMDHGGRTAALLHHLPIRWRQGKRCETRGSGFNRCRDDRVRGA